MSLARSPAWAFPLGGTGRRPEAARVTPQAQTRDATVRATLADPPSGAAAPLPGDDFDLLLHAVRQRLQASALAAPMDDPLALVVLDCVQALQMLQALLEAQRRAGPRPPTA